ncbi:DUF4160 domain-containing protein [Xanthobacter oligotrophicus]|uniref:DUF4160 domain-containing protein n=1 Tax=Xanthobacter oligotrophicus TaxID=2607286 RepID=UPI0011F38BD0|nr:DUF4160 domain-containing protein [Xanthobacter oligotrophicus]MCG5237582.1 DUF4160 domain-containing protein [Xanthobacter oligotrophicus]
MTEYVVEIPKELAHNLEQRIWLARGISRPGRGDKDFSPEFLVVSVSGFKVEIFANEHPPPHFRVAVGSSTANYTIDDFRRMNGSGEVLRYEKIVKSWWSDNKSALVNTWNSSRPTDCPVGKIGAPAPRKRAKGRKI